jgi:hypothetical protein
MSPLRRAVHAEEPSTPAGKRRSAQNASHVRYPGPPASSPSSYPQNWENQTTLIPFPDTRVVGRTILAATGFQPSIALHSRRAVRSHRAPPHRFRGTTGLPACRLNADPRSFASSAAKHPSSQFRTPKPHSAPMTTLSRPLRQPPPARAGCAEKPQPPSQPRRKTEDRIDFWRVLKDNLN